MAYSRRDLTFLPEHYPRRLLRDVFTVVEEVCAREFAPFTDSLLMIVIYPPERSPMIITRTCARVVVTCVRYVHRSLNLNNFSMSNFREMKPLPS